MSVSILWAFILSSVTTLQSPIALPTDVLKQEQERVSLVKKISPPTVAVVSGGGSGVLISEEGYALTNFHVVGTGSPALKCGLPDGKLYDGVIVGLDKMGDLALIKLIGPKPEFKFPFATMGDSDEVQTGDWAVAAGNPFLLASDFTPTVTFGLVSGTHRYQYPEHGLHSDGCFHQSRQLWWAPFQHEGATDWY
jgi:S1-C subfamily serine protease